MSETAAERRLRVRALLGRWFWVLAIALVAIGLFSGYVAATSYLAPGTHAEERVDSSWTVESSLAHEAPVVASNPVFEKGSTLEDRSVYYRSIAPVANGTYVFSYGSSVGGDLAVESNVVLQIRSVGEDGETVYWETNRQLASRSVTGVSPGDTVATEFRLNTTAVAQRLDAIESSLGGGPGSIRADVVVWSTFEGTVAGTSVQDRELHRVPISIESGTYSFEDSGPWQRQIQETRQVQVPNEQGPVGSIVAPIVTLLSLVGLGLLGLVYTRDLHELTAGERAKLSYFRDRSSYDEWIPRARLPEGGIGERRASVATLEDLVDLAIDTDERVIEDTGRNAYGVQHEDVYYIYSPPVQIQSAPSAGDEDPL